MKNRLSVIYTRASGDRSSLQEQQRLCQKALSNRGIRPITTMVIADHAAASDHHRLGFGHMANLCLDGRVQRIVVADLTRLGRDTTDLKWFLEEMRRCRVEVMDGSGRVLVEGGFPDFAFGAGL